MGQEDNSLGIRGPGDHQVAIRETTRLVGEPARLTAFGKDDEHVM
jgi:hypothetical protein